MKQDYGYILICQQSIVNQIKQNQKAKIMGFISSAHDQVGLAFSIVGLTLVVPAAFLFKCYLPFFDHIQLVFLYAMVLAPMSETFGSHLDESWGKFVPNFLRFCTEGDLVCSLGFALSFTICLLGVIFLLWFIVTLEKCRKPDLKFEPVYSVFKGLFRWTYIPLVYYSLSYLVLDLNASSTTNLVASIVILAWTVLFPVVQLIGYKLTQQEKDNIFHKWFQFLSYYRLLLVTVTLVLGAHLTTNKTEIAKYFVYGSLVLYAALHLWKGIYVYNVLERVLYGIVEAIAITIFSLYLFDVEDMVKYELDFIGLAVILLLDIIFIILRLISWLVYGKTDVADANQQNSQKDRKVIPDQKPKNKFQVIDISEDFKIKKKNKYEESEDLQNSRDELMKSQRSSPAKKKK